jgi:aspartate-semialdehyde dehydrogenase
MITADNLRLGAATNAVRMASRWFPAADVELQVP